VPEFPRNLTSLPVAIGGMWALRNFDHPDPSKDNHHKSQPVRRRRLTGSALMSAGAEPFVEGRRAAPFSVSRLARAVMTSRIRSITERSSTLTRNRSPARRAVARSSFAAHASTRPCVQGCRQLGGTTHPPRHPAKALS
jgi:hypothetical protein